MSIEQKHKEFIQLIEKYQSNVLEEVLLAKKQFSQVLSVVCETGVDHERHFCFKDVEIDETSKISYYNMDRGVIVNFKKFLDNMQPTNDDMLKLHQQMNSHDILISIYPTKCEEYETLTRFVSLYRDLGNYIWRLNRDYKELSE